jgi:sterol 3beta-glucosyltransferase
MRIAIIASGSRGDVQPYVALGKGLVEAGHDVRIVAPQNFAGLVEAHGLDFWPIDVDVAAVAQNQTMSDRLERGNFIFIMAEMAKAAKQGAIHMAEAGLAACQGMDFILGGMGGVYPGIALAEKLELPFLQAYLVPFTPTGTFPSVLLDRAPSWFGGNINRLTHHIMRQMMWQGFRAGDNAARKTILDMPNAPFFGPYNASCTTAYSVLYGFSPAVLPPPADWGTLVHVTGYWFLDAARTWTPPEDLAAFLDDGPAPVSIGFGSMSSRNPEETTTLILEAVAHSGQRAILLSGWQGMRQETLPDSVFMIRSVPHAWLFPRMVANVHHGGAGTTAAALRAGVPSLVVPFFGDQPFWGKRIAELGVGPSALPRKKLTSDKLAEAIHQMVIDQAMRQRASDLADTIQAEDGIGRAVAIIQNLNL